ncbi:hypothetical protein LXL04_034113 [Taraxacum kok-saghyz]
MAVAIPSAIMTCMATGSNIGGPPPPPGSDLLLSEIERSRVVILNESVEIEFLPAQGIALSFLCSLNYLGFNKPSDHGQFCDGETQTRASHRISHDPKGYAALGVSNRDYVLRKPLSVYPVVYQIHTQLYDGQSLVNRSDQSLLSPSSVMIHLGLSYVMIVVNNRKWGLSVPYRSILAITFNKPSDHVQFRDGETQTRASHRTVHDPKDYLAPGIGSCSVFTYNNSIVLSKPKMTLHDYQVKNGQGEDQIGEQGPFGIFSRLENIPSFAKAITNGDTVDDTLEYKELPHKDHIIILENKDIMLYFENNDDPWFLMSRYLDTASYAGFSYKNRNYYENILKVTESVEFSHFTSGGNTNIYNFSKAIIKKIILAEEWGLSTLKEREFMMPPSKTPVKFTYWDYIESFHKAFLYENPQRKHTWFFKVCENVYKHNKEIPNWFTNWWISYGPRIDILPEDPFRNLYGEWITVSPRYSKHLTQKTGGALEVISSLHFFMEFSIPWIWKWSPHVDYTPSSFPSLQRKYFTKFWPKMLHKDPETKALQAQQTIDHINQQIQKYQQQKNFPDPTSPNSQQVNKTIEDIIKNFRLYCSQLKQDLNKIKSKEMGEEEDSNEDSMSIENNQYQCLAGESQSEEEAIPFEDMLDMLEESILLSYGIRAMRTLCDINLYENEYLQTI